jgi:V/A-type H+-transporting ATPase subunit A
VYATGFPLRVHLGPGLLGSIYDGLQRPLHLLAAVDGDYLRRGRHAPPLDPARMWHFVPAIRAGDVVAAGEMIGRLQETVAIEHRVLVPPELSGTVVEIAGEGEYRVGDVVARLAPAQGPERALSLSHFWPARRGRPFARRLPLNVPLLTGQRVLDSFFPVAAGGTVGMPGGFGTGKTVLQHQLCKWAEADVIVFIGCGERGNEMAEVLSELPTIVDPRTRRPLSERTVLIANTSDMPVAAREASLYVGATIGEYYRDMGYRVLLLADSTSRWAEALREIAGRMEEMPAEEGYPPYLASRLAAFYERAGRVTSLNGAEGSLTIVGAVSPPGGDLTEPVTRHTERLSRSFWVLDRALAHARRFPAISVTGSHSDGAAQLGAWWKAEYGVDWWALRNECTALLAEAERADATARLIGTSGLPAHQQLLLAAAALIQDAFFRQTAGSADDWCSPRKQIRMLELLLRVSRTASAAVAAGADVGSVLRVPSLAAIRRAGVSVCDADLDQLDRLASLFDDECDAAVASRGVPA